MAQGVRLHVWGDLACFTRPELKVERVSYDVMTPSAARGILEAIHWKPAIRWEVERIHVLRPIRWRSIRRNEVSEKASAALARRAMNAGTTAGLGIDVADKRQQRAAMVLEDVGYVIEARFHMTERAGAEDTPAKHISMFNRRAESGQCFHRPCLGVREFPAEFRLLAEDEAVPASALAPGDRDRDLGWMTYEPGYPGAGPARFFRARLDDGVVEVARLAAQGLAA
jgi:CRISPR-associated protein Cas5d